MPIESAQSREIQWYGRSLHTRAWCFCLILYFNCVWRAQSVLYAIQWMEKMHPFGSAFDGMVANSESKSGGECKKQRFNALKIIFCVCVYCLPHTTQCGIRSWYEVCWYMTHMIFIQVFVRRLAAPPLPLSSFTIAAACPPAFSFCHYVGSTQCFHQRDNVKFQLRYKPNVCVCVCIRYYLKRSEVRTWKI